MRGARGRWRRRPGTRSASPSRSPPSTPRASSATAVPGCTRSCRRRGGPWGGIVGSMSRRGNCWDNAVAESFFSTLKIELAYTADWATRADARAAVFEYLEVFYNGQRRHSALGYLSPVAFEQRYEEKALAA